MAHQLNGAQLAVLLQNWNHPVIKPLLITAAGSIASVMFFKNGVPIDTNKLGYFLARVAAPELMLGAYPHQDQIAYCNIADQDIGAELGISPAEEITVLTSSSELPALLDEIAKTTPDFYVTSPGITAAPGLPLYKPGPLVIGAHGQPQTALDTWWESAVPSVLGVVALGFLGLLFSAIKNSNQKNSDADTWIAGLQSQLIKARSDLERVTGAKDAAERSYDARFFRSAEIEDTRRAQFRHREKILRDLISKHALLILVLQTAVKVSKRRQREAQRRQKEAQRAAEAKLRELEAAKQDKLVATKLAAQVARRRQRVHDSAASSAEIDQLNHAHEKYLAALNSHHLEEYIALEIRKDEAREEDRLYWAYVHHQASNAEMREFRNARRKQLLALEKHHRKAIDQVRHQASKDKTASEEKAYKVHVGHTLDIRYLQEKLAELNEKHELEVQELTRAKDSAEQELQQKILGLKVDQQKQIEMANEQLEVKNTEIDAVRRENTELTEKVKQLEELSSKRVQDIEMARNKNVEHITAISRLESDLQQKSKDLDTIRLEKAELTDKVKQLEETSQKGVPERRTLQDKMDAASKEKGHPVEEVSRLEADLKVESSDLDTVRDKNTELTDKIEQLQSDFQEKSVGLEKAHEKTRLQTRDNDNAQREKTEIASKLDELTQRLADESREHDQERESWTQSSSNKDKEIISFRRLHESSQDELARLDQKLSDDAKQASANSIKLQAQIRTSETKFSQKECDCKKLLEQKADAEKIVAEKDLEVAQLKSQHDTAITTNKTTRQQCKSSMR
jgi:hypothetical protein